MMLTQILQNCPVRQVLGPSDVEVAGLCCDSRRVRKGEAFFALRGVAVDGHRFIDTAVAQGASVIFLEEEQGVEPAVTRVVVENGRQAMAKAAQNFYGDPTSGMTVVGVTGTNGKTTITYLLESILQAAGKAPAVMGTISYRFANQEIDASHTTPESVDLLGRVAAFRDAGADSLVIEVSSHALDQFRADGLHYRVGIFTNLTPEHLDYHPDMEHYFQSKGRLFHELLATEEGRAVINIDDPYGQRLAEELPDALTCGRHQSAAIHPVVMDISLHGIKGRVRTPAGELEVNSRLLGEYNVENLLCAIGAGIALGLPLRQIERGISATAGVPGRLETIENTLGAVILVDYAHTGDALQRVLDAMQQLTPKRILTVFGCGGDRDAGKRPVMGEISARCSDLAIATSDNPRTEDPLEILGDVRVGLERVYDREWTREEAATGTGRGYVVIPDRREAIRFAVSQLGQDDLLLVAGKGHEDYQILGTDRIHFDDREEIRMALQGETA